MYILSVYKMYLLGLLSFRHYSERLFCLAFYFKWKFIVLIDHIRNHFFVFLRLLLEYFLKINLRLKIGLTYAILTVKFVFCCLWVFFFFLFWFFFFFVLFCMFVFTFFDFCLKYFLLFFFFFFFFWWVGGGGLNLKY